MRHPKARVPRERPGTHGDSVGLPWLLSFDLPTRAPKNPTRGSASAPWISLKPAIKRGQCWSPCSHPGFFAFGTSRHHAIVTTLGTRDRAGIAPLTATFASRQFIRSRGFDWFHFPSLVTYLPIVEKRAGNGRWQRLIKGAHWWDSFLPFA